MNKNVLALLAINIINFVNHFPKLNTYNVFFQSSGVILLLLLRNHGVDEKVLILISWFCTRHEHTEPSLIRLNMVVLVTLII